jgi:hypothetical protein
VLEEKGAQCHSLSALPPGRRATTHCTGGWVGLGPDLDGTENPSPLERGGVVLTPDHPVHKELLY